MRLILVLLVLLPSVHGALVVLPEGWTVESIEGYSEYEVGRVLNWSVVELSPAAETTIIVNATNDTATDQFLFVVPGKPVDLSPSIAALTQQLAALTQAFTAFQENQTQANQARGEALNASIAKLADGFSTRTLEGYLLEMDSKVAKISTAKAEAEAQRTSILQYITLGMLLAFIVWTERSRFSLPSRFRRDPVSESENEEKLRMAMEAAQTRKEVEYASP